MNRKTEGTNLKIQRPAVGLLCAFLFVISANAQTATVQLPSAAHAVGQFAGSYVDPSTGFRVYRLSDRTLCPVNAGHYYSYSNQFSPAGRIVFTCQATTINVNIRSFPVYDSTFKLLYLDAIAAAGGPMPDGDAQWSQKREVLFGNWGLKIFEYDPFNGTHRVFADFSAIQFVTRPDGTQVGISGVRALSVGPGDRIMVHLQCHLTLNCPANYAVVGVGTYDPATGRYSAIAVPHAVGVAPKGFDEAEWTQNPTGRVAVIYANWATYSFVSDLSSNVLFDDHHGHAGYFLGVNGSSYKVSVKEDTLPNGGIGQIGCIGVTPWTSEFALYNDATGKRVLVWGCDMPTGTLLANARTHFSRVLGSTSKDAFFGSGFWIARFTVQYSGTTPSSVAGKLIASSRSDPSLCSGDYWAQPRATADHTGTRVLWDTNWHLSTTPTLESDGSVITSCKKDVVVAVYTATSSSPDLTPPAVSIASAVPRTVRTLTVGFTATDNVGVIRVEAYLDGIFLGSVDPRVTQSATYDVTSFIAGTHSLQLKAFDAAGNSNTASQYVNLP